MGPNLKGGWVDLSKVRKKITFVSMILAPNALKGFKRFLRNIQGFLEGPSGFEEGPRGFLRISTKSRDSKRYSQRFFSEFTHSCNEVTSKAELGHPYP